MNKLYMGVAALALCLGFTACSDDEDGPSYSTATVQNTELKTILAQKGYQFNADGNLLLDELANNTTTLDLSGTNISTDALSELSILPNLTEVDLSDNGYSLSFDFSSLPEQITGVDLTGNELYEFPGLVDIETLENGDENVTILRPLTKLYLPESAKYNCNEIVAFYQNVPNADMQMEDGTDNLSAYNTLREVPDEGTRAILQNTFPSIFDGDEIDISKRLVLSSERNKDIGIYAFNIPSTSTVDEIQSVEGFQYVVMNKGWLGTSINLVSSSSCEIPYLKLGNTISTLVINNISTGEWSFDDAVNLCTVQMTKNPGIETLDLSNCELLGQRGYDLETSPLNNPSNLFLRECKNLSTFILPAEAKIIMSLTMIDLPELKKLDLSGCNSISSILLGHLPACDITYFDYTIDPAIRMFGITKDVYEQTSTKNFLDKYHDVLMYSSLSMYGVTDTFDWRELYN